MNQIVRCGLSLYVAIAVALASSACTTRAIPRPERFSVPQGLSVEGVRSAIVAALSYDAAPSMVTSSRPRVWGGYSGSVRPGPLTPQWYPTGEKDGVIFATYQSAGGNVLNARIDYTDKLVVVAITDSVRLRQSSSKIHKIARIWIRDLNSRVRISLGRASVRP